MLSSDVFMKVDQLDLAADAFTAAVVPRKEADALLGFRVLKTDSDKPVSIVWRYYGDFELPPMTCIPGRFYYAVQDEIPIFPLATRYHSKELRSCGADGRVELVSACFRDNATVRLFASTLHLYPLPTVFIRQEGPAGMVGFEPSTEPMEAKRKRLEAFCRKHQLASDPCEHAFVPCYKDLMAPFEARAARRIQREFKHAISCPDHALCRERLTRELVDMTL